MRKFRVDVPLLVNLFAVIAICQAVLTGYEESSADVTSDPKYGCLWSGGTSVAANCTCRSDAEEFFIRKDNIRTYGIQTLVINDCKKVIFGPNSIEDFRNLRNIVLNNIPSLSLETSSLNWFGYGPNYQEEETEDVNNPSLKISINNCKIESVSSYTFKGRIQEVSFDNCRIQVMESFAFSTLKQNQQISFKNTEIINMKSQTFKQFSTKELLLDNVTTAMIPSKAFSTVAVSEDVKIINCNFQSVRSSAFQINNPKVLEVIGTNIDQLDGEAFIMTVRDSVLFQNNNFKVINDAAFRKIVPTKEYAVTSARFMTFDSNVFTNLSRYSLDITDFVPKFVNLKINQPCDCDKVMARFDLYEDNFSEIKCRNNEEYVSLNEYKSNECTVLASYTKTIVIVSLIIGLSLVIGISYLLYYYKVYKVKKYGDKKNTANNNLSLIVPDGRTYKETELHVIVERADLLTTDL